MMSADGRLDIGIVAGTTIQIICLVFDLTAVKRIVAGAAVDGIDTRHAAQGIVAVQPIQFFIAAPASKHVVACRSQNNGAKMTANIGLVPHSIVSENNTVDSLFAGPCEIIEHSNAVGFGWRNSQVVPGAPKQRRFGINSRTKGHAVGRRRMVGAGVVDDVFAGIQLKAIAVAAAPPSQRVPTASADQGVVRRITDYRIIQFVASTYRSSTGQGKAVEIAGQRITHARLNQVESGIKLFQDTVAAIVDNKYIVAHTAEHAVRARAAVQQVIAAATDEIIVAAKSGQGVVAIQAT